MKRMLIFATFKTSVGEVMARVQHDHEGVFAFAWMADTHVHGNWTLTRDVDGSNVEWMRDGVTVAPPNNTDLDCNIENALRNATRAMLAWVTP